MIKYGKVIDELTGLCEIGTGTNVEFYKSIGFIELDVKQSDIDNNWYLSEKCPIKTEDDREKEEKEKRKAEITEQIEKLDLQRIRAIAEPSVKDEETGETWLEFYTEQIKSLREELKEMGV